MISIDGVLRPCLILNNGIPAPVPVDNNNPAAGKWFDKPLFNHITRGYNLTTGYPPHPVRYNGTFTKAAIKP